MSLGENLKKFRKMRGMTQLELAQKANLSRTYIADVERGRYNPSAEVLNALADALEVSADVLLGRSIGVIIENRMKELGLSWQELSATSGVPLEKLLVLDSLRPRDEDYRPGGLIDRLSKVLDIDFEALSSAYVRKEAPVLDDELRQKLNEIIQYHKAVRLSRKEERDIAKELERIMSALESDNALVFDGEPLTDEDRELLRISLENSLRAARIIAKKKFSRRNKN